MGRTAGLAAHIASARWLSVLAGSVASCSLVSAIVVYRKLRDVHPIVESLAESVDCEHDAVTIAHARHDDPQRLTSPWAYALLGSMLVHAGVACAATVFGVPWLLLPRIAPVETGLESIALRASMGSLGESDDGRVSPVEVTAVIEMKHAKETTAPRLSPEPTVASQRVTNRVDAEHPDRPDAAMIGEMPKEMQLAKVPPKRHLFQEQPKIERDDVPALPRAIVADEAKIEVDESALKSEASPGSESSQGVYVDVKPVVVFNPRPPYPPALLQARITGLVKLAVTVGVDGTVTALSVHESSGRPELDQSSLDTVRQWRFRPALRHGQPVEWTVAVPINFVIDPRAGSATRRTR